MPRTILLAGESLHIREFVVGAFYSKDRKVLSYYWYAESARELKERIRQNTLERPCYIIRVKPKNLPLNRPLRQRSLP